MAARPLFLCLAFLFVQKNLGNYVSPSRIWTENIKDGRFQIQIGLARDFGNKQNKAQKLLNSVVKDFKTKTAIELVQCHPLRPTNGLPKCGRKGFKSWIILSARAKNGLDGCSSWIGRHGSDWMGIGGQEISLASGCLYKNTIVHQIMHALGFVHEFSRPDRDNYIDIIWENIDKSNWHNFEKEVNGKVFGTTFDPKSVMQWHSKAFTKDWNKPTMQSKDPNSLPLPTYDIYFSEEYQKGLSKDDAFKINNVYTLADYCKKMGENWAFGNGQKCTGSGNCIIKGVKVPGGSTCVDEKWVTSGDWVTSGEVTTPITTAITTADTTPSSAVPTTDATTTNAPTTNMQTTGPTSAAPTTQNDDGSGDVTTAITTAITTADTTPSSAMPTTNAPTTNAPTTNAPTTQYSTLPTSAPTTVSTDAPTTNAPTTLPTSAPTTIISTDAPTSTQNPTTLNIRTSAIRKIATQDDEKIDDLMVVPGLPMIKKP